MADNTILNANTTAGDSIRDLARAAGTVKTQVVQLDLGGVTANAEVLITAGQQLMAVSVPVVIASNQTAVPVSLAAETTKVIGTVNVASSALPGTFSATISGLALAALATDVFTLTGSATKTVRVTKVYFNASQTTAGQVGVILLRRSTADTLGTSTAPTATTYDTNNAAATAIAAAYTANPTAGTLVGNISSHRVFVPSAATASDAQGLSIVFGNTGQQYPTLRGVAQQFCINLGGATVTGGSANISIEWTET